MVFGPFLLCVCLPTAQDATDAFDDNPLPGLLAALMNVTLSEEIAGASFRIDNGGNGADDTRLQVFKLPWSDELDVGSTRGTLHVSAAAGLLLADDGIQVDTPSGLATVDEVWLGFGGPAGVGWTHPLGRGWAVRPGLALALSYLQNDAHFNAAGAIELEPVIGDLVDWDAWAAIGSATLTVENPRDPEVFSTGFVARGAVARTRVFAATHEFLEGRDTNEFLVARGELGGPTAWSCRDERILWDGFADWTGLYDVDEEAIGFDEFFQFGGGLTARVSERLALLRVSAGWVVGPDIRGWSLGLSLSL